MKMEFFLCCCFFSIAFSSQSFLFYFFDVDSLSSARSLNVFSFPSTRSVFKCFHNLTSAPRPLRKFAYFVLQYHLGTNNLLQLFSPPPPFKAQAHKERLIDVMLHRRRHGTLTNKHMKPVFVSCHSNE